MLFNLADENPTVNRAAWIKLCEALIAEKLAGIKIIGLTRADDIVRDADILHLYRKAGFERFLLGIENTDEATLQKIRKGGATKTDREAIRVMRKAGILSLATWVADFEDVRGRDLFRSLRQLLSYDPDQITALYVTPHRWTGYFRQAIGRKVIQLDQRRWDYKHQVLASRHMSPWRVTLCVKLIELLVQARPRACCGRFFIPTNSFATACAGTPAWAEGSGSTNGGHFSSAIGACRTAPHCAFWGEPQDHAEVPLRIVRAGPVRKTLSLIEGSKVFASARMD